VKLGTFQQRVALPRIFLGFSDKTRNKKINKVVKLGTFQQRVALPRISLGFSDKTKLKNKNKLRGLLISDREF